MTTKMRAITTVEPRTLTLSGGQSSAGWRPKRNLTGPALLISQERSVVSSVDTNNNTGIQPANTELRVSFHLEKTARQISADIRNKKPNQC